jgi:molybdopterin synthase sulfur carrier subunit
MPAYLASAQGQAGRAGQGLIARHPRRCDHVQALREPDDYLPADAQRSNQVSWSPRWHAHRQIIEPFGMPEKLVHLVLVNGVYVAPAERLTFWPKDGDVLAIWPPIAGG